MKRNIVLCIIIGLYFILGCSNKESSSEESSDQIKIELSMDSDSFKNETILLPGKSRYLHYSQAVISKNDEILIPTENGFLFGINIYDDNVKLKFMPVQAEIFLEKQKRKLVRALVNFHSPNQKTKELQALSVKSLLKLLNENEFKEYSIPIIEEINSHSGIYLVMYQFTSFILDLSQSIENDRITLFAVGDFKMRNTFYENNDRVNLYIDYSGRRSDFGLDFKLGEKYLFLNPNLEEKILFDKTQLFNNEYYAYPSSNILSISRKGNLVAVRSLMNISENIDVIPLRISIFTIDKDNNPVLNQTWLSSYRESDKRISFPKVFDYITDFDQLLMFPFINGDPVHPLIELDSGDYLTCYSNIEKREWVKFDGEDFISVGGPTVISSELPLSFSIHRNGKYLFLFRDSDNAFCRYEVNIEK